ncbi:hypothetical protein ACA910_015250 [Epithemia clementina (nom. ined.)]
MESKEYGLMDANNNAILAVLDRAECQERVESNPQQVEDSIQQGTDWSVTGSMLLGSTPSAGDRSGKGRVQASVGVGGDLKTMGSFGITSKGKVLFADLGGVLSV